MSQTPNAAGEQSLRAFSHLAQDFDCAWARARRHLSKQCSAIQKVSSQTGSIIADPLCGRAVQQAGTVQLHLNERRQTQWGWVRTSRSQIFPNLVHVMPVLQVTRRLHSAQPMFCATLLTINTEVLPAEQQLLQAPWAGLASRHVWCAHEAAHEKLGQPRLRRSSPAHLVVRSKRRRWPVWEDKICSVANRRQARPHILSLGTLTLLLLLHVQKQVVMSCLCAASHVDTVTWSARQPDAA